MICFFLDAMSVLFFISLRQSNRLRQTLANKDEHIIAYSSRAICWKHPLLATVVYRNLVVNDVWYFAIIENDVKGIFKAGRLVKLAMKHVYNEELELPQTFQEKIMNVLIIIAAVIIVY